MRIPRPPRPRTLFRLIMIGLSQLKWGVVVAVTVLIASIVLPGEVVVLPQVCSFPGSHVSLILIMYNDYS